MTLFLDLASWASWTATDISQRRDDYNSKRSFDWKPIRKSLHLAQALEEILFTTQLSLWLCFLTWHLERANQQHIFQNGVLITIQNAVLIESQRARACILRKLLMKCISQRSFRCDFVSWHGILSELISNTYFKTTCWLQFKPQFWLKANQQELASCASS